MEDVKVTELSEFMGGTDPKRYLEWERKTERMFELKELDDENCFKFVIIKLSEGTLLWFEGLKAKRVRQGKRKISSGESLKRKLRRRYIPIKYRITTYRGIVELKRGNMSMGSTSMSLRNYHFWVILRR